MSKKSFFKYLNFNLITSYVLSVNFKENLRMNPSLLATRGRRRQSLVDLSVKILTEERKPLHVNDLVRILQQRFGRLTDRDTLSSALAKKARQGILLRQSNPATFALIDSKEDYHAKT